MSRRLRKTESNTAHEAPVVIAPGQVNSKPSAGESVVDSDESAANQTEEPDAIMEQAAADLSHGLKDTDRSPQMDVTYKKLKVKP